VKVLYGAGGPALSARGLTKRFPGVLAVDRVDFDVHACEIVALLGQNGAGKSTLIQMLAGAHPHGTYSGEIVLGGRPFRPRSVAEAERAGIALVPQEINVAPDLGIAQNLFLNAEPARLGFIDRPMQKMRARQVLLDFGLDVDVEAPMGTLDLATQQLVIIARALSKNARVLILDEPTAALTHNEAQRLFGRLHELCARGVGVVFVSHRLAEVFEVSDRIVVMRDGRVCGEFVASDTTRDAVVAQMVGKAMRAPERKVARTTGADALAVEGLTVWDPARPDRKLVDGLGFVLRRGETLGLFGLMGSGCIEAALALYGAWRGEWRGSLHVDGHAATIRDPAGAIAHGVGLMAQDRRDCLLPEQSILGNSLLASLVRYSPRGIVDWLAFRQRAIEIAQRLDIKAASVDVLVATLSGGNQQKVQIARWLASQVHVLLLVDPTRGVDVGARAEIARIWRELASLGYALLLVSTDAEEIVELCDRTLVLRNGRLAAELRQDDLTEERLLRAATGV
jgi:ABC-type sugar transport system ATPase subunit